MQLKSSDNEINSGIYITLVLIFFGFLNIKFQYQRREFSFIFFKIRFINNLLYIFFRVITVAQIFRLVSLAQSFYSCHKQKSESLLCREFKQRQSGDRENVRFIDRRSVKVRS